MNGQAIDRHLLGLKLAALESRMNLPELFMDSSYQYALHYKLSTSQVGVAALFSRKSSFQFILPQFSILSGQDARVIFF